MKLINLYIGVGQGILHDQHKKVMEKEEGDWVLVDKYIDAPDVVKMDGANLTYDPESINVIYASHLLEHFDIRQVPLVLQNWYKVLRPGGKVIINVPDFDWICSAWLNPDMRLPYWKEDLKMLEAFFGGQDEPGEYHRTGFSEPILRSRLEEAMLRNIRTWKEIEAHDMGVVWAEAYK